MASAQAQKPTTTIEVCQPKSQHSSFGQKLSEITSKALHHARHGSNQNQIQNFSQTQVESHGNSGSKTETHSYGQTKTQRDKKHGVTKTEITVCVVKAQITQTNEDPPSPRGTTTKCFGPHARKIGEVNNHKERNIFRRIKNGMSRHNNEGSSSSDSESDDDKCPKTDKYSKTDKSPKTDKFPKTDKCPKTKN